MTKATAKAGKAKEPTLAELHKAALDARANGAYEIALDYVLAMLAKAHSIVHAIKGE